MRTRTAILAAGMFAVVAAAVGTVDAGKTERVTVDAIAAKPTAWGRQINDLHAFNGKIYMGYGDWNANGRVAVQIYDPATGEISRWPTNTGNAVHFMYDAGNKLYAVGPESGGVHWTDGTNYGRYGCCTHEFGAVEHNGVLYVSGQNGNNDGVVRAYYQDGTSETIFTGPPESFRFHGIGVIGNELWVFGQGDEFVMDLTTGVWTPKPNTLWYWMMYKATSFADHIVGLRWYPTGSVNHRGLHAFDGQNAPLIADAIDLAVDGEYLYILEANGAIKRTTDLQSWEQVKKFKGGGGGRSGGTSARSVEVLDGVIYVGDDKSTLHILQPKGGQN